ncbi:hypothetical protein C0991_004121, partial [Blastosporella zonata]
ALACSLDTDVKRAIPPTPDRNDPLSLFRAYMSGDNYGGISKQKVLDGVFRLLMSYRVLDVQSYITGSDLTGTNEPVPVSYHSKLPMVYLNDMSVMVSSPRSTLAAHFRFLGEKS